MAQYLVTGAAGFIGAHTLNFSSGMATPSPAWII